MTCPRRHIGLITNVYNFTSIKNTLTHTCAHTPTRVPLSLGRKTLSWNSCSLLYMSRLTGSLTPAAAVPVSCLLHRCPGCVSPRSRRASVRSPPCSRQRSLICRRTVQPLLLFSPAAKLAHTKVIPAAPTATERRGARHAAGDNNNTSCILSCN